MKIFFSPKYTVDIGDHVFPTVKFAMAAQALRSEIGVQFVEPAMPGRDDLMLAHGADWVDRVLGGKLTLKEETLMELPWSRELAEAHALSVAGTILACREAVTTGLGLHCGGGSHHAFPDHGEGFCIFNDLACGIVRMFEEKRIRRAMVVDLDVHQGNGTAACFRDRPEVFTFSMHQGDIYPTPKTPGSLDVELAAGTRDAEYLSVLEKHLPRILDEHKPDLVVYQSGVDVFEKDLLGGMKLTKEGVAGRDQAVLKHCALRRVPLAVTLGGGYAERLEDTAALHAQTLILAMENYRYAGSSI